MSKPQPGLFDKTPAEELAEVLPAQLAAEVVKHRKLLKKPLTGYAGKLLADKLRKCGDPIAAANMMIEKGWQSIEVGWMESTDRSRMPVKATTGVAAEREKLREEIESEQFGEQGQAQADPRHAGGLFLLDGPRPLRAH